MFFRYRSVAIPVFDERTELAVFVDPAVPLRRTFCEAPTAEQNKGGRWQERQKKSSKAQPEAYETDRKQKNTRDFVHWLKGIALVLLRRNRTLLGLFLLDVISSRKIPDSFLNFVVNSKKNKILLEKTLWGFRCSSYSRPNRRLYFWPQRTDNL
jgi:hypothetical protein